MDVLEDGISCMELLSATGNDKGVTDAIGENVDLGAHFAKTGDTRPFLAVKLIYRIKAPLYIVRWWNKHGVGKTPDSKFSEWVGAGVRPQFYVPLNIGRPHREKMYRHLDQAADLYVEMLELGIKDKHTKTLLPPARYTEVCWICTLPAAVQFYKLHIRDVRDDMPPEALRYVFAMSDMTYSVAPLSWLALTRSNAI